MRQLYLERLRPLLERHNWLNKIRHMNHFSPEFKVELEKYKTKYSAILNYNTCPWEAEFEYQRIQISALIDAWRHARGLPVMHKPSGADYYFNVSLYNKLLLQYYKELTVGSPSQA